MSDTPNLPYVAVPADLAASTSTLEEYGKLVVDAARELGIGDDSYWFRYPEHLIPLVPVGEAPKDEQGLAALPPVLAGLALSQQQPDNCGSCHPEDGVDQKGGVPPESRRSLIRRLLAATTVVGGALFLGRRRDASAQSHCWACTRQHQCWWDPTTCSGPCNAWGACFYHTTVDHYRRKSYAGDPYCSIYCWTKPVNSGCGATC